MDGLIKPSDPSRNGGYGPMAGAPEQSLAAFAQHLTGPHAPNPHWVADAVASLIKTPRGKCPFRTTVDRLGMAAAVDPYNQAADDLQKKVHAAFGMSDALKLRT